MHPPNTILYVEDDVDDVMFLKEAFRKLDSSVRLQIAGNGDEALLFLDTVENENDLPCLIILDINMPGMDGRRALAHLKQSERYKNLPVIMFTTSSSPLDKMYAAQWGAELITKPVTAKDIDMIVQTFLRHCKENSKKVL